MNRAWLFCAVLVAFVVVNGCDSERNIDLPSDSYFLKFFGGDGNQEGVDLAVAPDGTILMFGTSELPNGLTQWYLVNADANGNLLWERTYGDPSKNDEARDIELTGDGRIVLAGNEENSPGEGDVFVMTLTLAGDPIDSLKVDLRDGAGNPFDEDVSSVTRIGTEFFVVGATTNLTIKPLDTQNSNDIRDALHLRLSDNLQLFDTDLVNGVWNPTNGFEADDAAVRLFPSNTPGQYYLFGYTNNEIALGVTSYNFWVQEIGSTGEAIQNGYSNATVNVDKLMSSVILSPIAGSFEFLMTGIRREGSSSDLYVAKVPAQIAFAPGILDGKNVLTVNNVTNIKTGAASATGSGFFIVGNIDTGDTNIFLIKINASLNLEWQTAVQFGGSNIDEVGAITELPDGRLAIVGTMSVGEIPGEKKMVLMKLNQQGRFAK